MTITERDSDLVETREAVFSTDHRYRYLLTRIWNPDVAPTLFICLNPSTADAMANDPTVRRMCGFARRENAGGIVVANLFALRSSNPAVLKRAFDPVGPDNDEHLRAAARAAARVVVAWGAGGSLAGRDRTVAQMLIDLGADLACLGRTQHGHPRHPLYVLADTPLESWRAEL